MQANTATYGSACPSFLELAIFSRKVCHCARDFKPPNFSVERRTAVKPFAGSQFISHFGWNQLHVSPPKK